MNEQEQLQRLGEEIAGAYLRHLKETTGGDTVTYDGVTKTVVFEQLVFGLVGVAHTNARKHPDDPVLKDPHKHLSQMIGNDSNLLIVFYVQIVPDDFVMQLHRF
ncbi:Uncharacterised protein [Klebsiella pneumoniae]|nr:Uncharacterised protein [Klebsiella pneumoniae]SWC25991.1 Uncharacterised protein [Klebsiella pneumoniae]